MREADESLVGRTIAGKFLVLEVLGQGAMGCVYKARQTTLDKIVAIKLLHPGLAEDPTFAARFKREAKAASKLDHPNSIRIIDFGEDEGALLFIAMEFVEGRSLLRLLQDEWPVAPARIVGILVQVLGALALAHDIGIVHRDIKPENILVTSTKDDEGAAVDIVKVCDFGIAKINESRAYQTGSGATGPLTRTGTLVGTPEYMSPEQGRGDPLDARSDLYSVGVILFQLLTGRVPFEAESAIGIILKHITDPPPDPIELNPAADPRLVPVALRAMSKARDERYASAREMRAALRAAVDGAGAYGPLSLPSTPSRPQMTGAVSTVAGLASGGSHPARSFPADVEMGHAATEAELTLPTTSRWKYAAALVAICGIGGAAFYLSQPPRGAGGPEPGHSGGEPPLAVLSPDDSPLSPLTFPSADGGKHAPPRRGPVAQLPPSPSKTLGPPSTTAALPLPTPAATASAPTPPASMAAPVDPAPPPASPPAPSPGSTYAVGRTWVEIGMVNGERVRDRDVRQSVATLRLGLGACYRASLVAGQSHATGIGVVNFSFDPQGHAAAAVVTNVQFLPDMARCLQQNLLHVMVPTSALSDGAGGTADVQLVFHNEP